jgi:Protein of unknown function, DUF481
MKKICLYIVSLVTVMAMACSAVLADQVTLKNGDRLTGSIVKSDDKALVIKTEFAGDVTVVWSAVAAINSSQPLHVSLHGGQTIVGPVTTTESGKIEVATPTSGEVFAPKDSIEVIRSDKEQAAYDAELERLRHPHLLDLWSGLLDTGLSVTRGNSDTLSFALAGKAIRTTDRDIITAYATAIYSTTGDPTVTTAHAIRGGVRGDLNLTDRFFAFGFTDFEYDAFQHLDLRNVLGGGAGYHVYKTKNTTFNVFGGADFEQEYYSNVEISNPLPPPATVLGNLTHKTAEIVIGEELNAKISGRTTLSERFAFYPNLSSGGDFRSQFDVTASTKLKNWLGWQVTYSDRYISNPPLGLKGNDQLLSTGLRLTFGKNAPK